MMTKRTAAPIVVPTLAESDAEYRAISERANALNEEIRALRPEQKNLRAEIAADDTREISPAVAELLGQPPSLKAEKRKRLGEVTRRLADTDTALGMLRQEQQRAESRASTALCLAMQPEFTKRVAALCAALEVVDAAHHDLDELRLAVEAEGANIGSLGPVMPYFLGGAREPQRRIAEYVKSMREAGYV